MGDHQSALPSVEVATSASATATPSTCGPTLDFLTWGLLHQMGNKANGGRKLINVRQRGDTRCQLPDGFFKHWRGGRRNGSTEGDDLRFHLHPGPGGSPCTLSLIATAFLISAPGTKQVRSAWVLETSEGG